MYFSGLHLRLQTLYDCGCDNCKTERINLAASGDAPKFKSVLKAAENAFKHLHQKGSYTAEDITEKPYQKLIDESYKALNSAITDNDIPPEMLSKLQNDTFIFSGLRTHAQLMEASSFLRDENGKIRGFDSFAHEFNRVNEKYNQNYLEAEYQFAVNSSQMAANWAATDPDGRYNLQYRTANDDRVRENHRVLQDITLPKEDSFWLSYYPPNGWRCRCTAVEVRKSKYEVSDSEDALTKGERATTQIGKDGKNKLEIFRFNPGAEKKVFPPKHPYNKVKGAEEVKQSLQPKYTPEKLKDYEKKLGLSVNKDFFKLLTKETPLHLTNPKGYKGSGAYYAPIDNFVRIPIDNRRKGSKWYAEAVVYHEFGHAADWQNSYKNRSEVKDTMNKHRETIKFSEVDGKLAKMSTWAYRKGKNDLQEKIAAARDTIMALNPNYGSGHTKTYYKMSGNKEAEFLAHAFENRFAGNEVIKKYLPDLYKDMVNLIDTFMKEQSGQE